MKRSRIQGHGEEGWGSRGSRFDRGRAIAPELSVDEFSRFAHVRCASSESRSDPELRVSSPGERPAGREAMVDRRLDRLLDRRLVVESDRCVAGCIGLDLLSVVLMARLRVPSALRPAVSCNRRGFPFYLGLALMRATRGLTQA